MKNLFKLLIVITLLFSCKKETEPIEKTITLTGRIILNCAGDPMANQNIELWLYLPDINFEILDVKTDANGNFSWTFDKPKSLIQIAIRPGGGGDILTFNPKHRNLGTIIATPKCNVVMKIKINNPYSFGDTLRLKDFPNHPTLKGINIAAPFRDTILAPAYNYSELSWPGTFEQKNTTYVSSIIYIYKGVSGTSSFTELYHKDYENRFKSCTGVMDTVLIEIN